MDVHDKKTRSYNMSCIKGKNTKPEEIVRKALFANGFRYRKNDSRLPGTPDIVLPKYRTVIFVNGCFWHGHKGCKFYVVPKTNTEFWINKINSNIDRDAKKAAQLKELGWQVITIWECELKKSEFDNTINTLIKNIKNNMHSIHGAGGV
ncbi:T/G mismatch-specific endonuclease [Ruminococcus sp. YE71]|uniref:very short patch repair endonuclease n=1 Tax=unclassified Ruminococcus TaxID=2608920 RepID=UPI0008876B64|nr:MULTISPECIES: very short patch repair endonuclease [unclassified Ruminococcus]SDA31413.1 T/G mismatch-specific endonuclease [Ruminococcus sp. YE78]SFW51627.1 T/G mismatch-specific endonuclease [Ruminococcus sp. YE71]